MPLSRRSLLGSLLAAGLVGDVAVLRRLLAADDAQSAAHIVHQDIRTASLNADLSLQFRGSTLADVQEWRDRFRARLAELLGDFEPPQTWQVAEEGRAEFDDHTRYELLLTAKNVPTVPVYLLLPRGASSSNRVPGVLCVHGHGEHGHHYVVGRTDVEGAAPLIKSANYDYGLQFVRRGYAVVAPCLIPFGRRLDREKYGQTDPCATTLVRMQALGQLPIASNLRDLRWSLDLLSRRPEVLPDRFGCAGLSYGGRMAMLASALDERIRVAAVSGALNLLQERILGRYSCGSQIIPGLLKYGDYAEIGGLIAPRPCVWEVGARDRLIRPEWADRFRDRLARTYAAWDAADQLHFDDFDGGHRWNGKAAFPLFDELLKA